jgi:hypothetical protein
MKIQRDTLKYTDVVFIVDESGSMSSVYKQTLDNFNEQIQTLKRSVDKNHKVLVTVIFFDDPGEGIKIVRDRIPVEAIKPLTKEDYRPNGSTALYDAIAFGIEKVDTPRIYEGNNAAIAVIMTDGGENASVRIKDSSIIKERITTLTKTDRWTFTYMGIGSLDEINRDFGIATGNAVVFQAGIGGMHVNSTRMTKGLDSYMLGRASGATATNSFYDTTTPVTPEPTDQTP